MTKLTGCNTATVAQSCDTCADGKYLHTMTCGQCVAECKTCTTDADCSACNDGWIAVNNACE